MSFVRATHFAFLALALGGCDGFVGSPPDKGGPTVPNPVVVPDPGVGVMPTDACAGVTVAAGLTSLRRLSVEEQRNSFRDILADATLTPALAPANGPVITEVEVDKLNLAVAALVGANKHLTYLPCDPAGAVNLGCADAFIASFGQVAFRRPLTDAEKLSLRKDVFDAIRARAEIIPAVSFREAIDAVAQAILQAPQLLYVHEDGVADATLPPRIRRLTGYERATRLSFLLWKTTPDSVLLAAAGAGTLDTAAGMRVQAERLIASPRSKGTVRGFVSSWLELDGNSHQPSLEATPKSLTAFPFDSPALRGAMREELVSLFDLTFFSPGASFKTLMTSNKAYVNKSLGTLYGVAAPPANDTTFAWVDLNAQQRAGLFTRAGFLSLYAPQDQNSPIRRGVFLFKEALCRPLGAPPANVNNTPFMLTDKPLTVREQVEARTGAASCQGCHQSINPLGFTLQGYDAIGRYQQTEKGILNAIPFELAINSTATPVGTDFDKPVAGPIELSNQLAQSGMAHDCLAATWFEQANPNGVTAAGGACSLQRLKAKFRQTDDMKDLLLTLATDDSALFFQETP